MIGENERLRKISESIFQQTKSSCPNSWRRGLHWVALPLKDIEIITGRTVHDKKYSFEEEKLAQPLKLITAGFSERITIQGRVDQEQMEDSLYLSVKEDGETDIFSLEKVSGEIIVGIRSAAPLEENEFWSTGVYSGSAGLTGFWSGGDQVYIDVTAPAEYLHSLVEDFRADPRSILTAQTFLQLFHYDEENPFNDSSLRQHFLIDTSTFTPCLLAGATVVTKVDQDNQSSEPVHQDSDDDESDWLDKVSQAEQTPEQLALQELLQVLLTCLKPLNRLVIAVWALIIVIALSAVFK